MEILTGKNISKIYNKKNRKITAVKNANISVNAGELIIIFGISGSGKSTLLRILGTIEKPTTGELIIDSKNITDTSYAELAKIRRHTISFVFQKHNLMPYLTVYENLLLRTAIAGIPKNEAKKRIEHELKELNILNLIDRYPDEISAGQYQRVAVARAIITNPRIILADEPTAMLDENMAKTLMDILQKIAIERNCAIIMTSTKTNILNYATKMYEMKNGILKLKQDVRNNG